MYFFTGIVQKPDGSSVKLYDPCDLNIDDPIGHEMAEIEFLTEFSCYDPELANEFEIPIKLGLSEK